MVKIRRGFLRAACGTAAGMLLAGCGFLNSGSMVAPTFMTVSSEAFQGTLPSDFTCHTAKPVSPPLNWSGAPSGTKEYALVVDDASAPITPYIYWIVFHIGPGTTDIQQGELPTDARQALNSAGFARYDAPCPIGSPHQYRFTVYALDTVLNLPNGTSLQSAWTAIAAATIGRGRTEPYADP
jgi:Raf kinase inhibitor-like YbhB/YbcL family protein